jgi:hypothetical protein
VKEGNNVTQGKESQKDTKPEVSQATGKQPELKEMSRGQKIERIVGPVICIILLILLIRGCGS